MRDSIVVALAHTVVALSIGLPFASIAGQAPRIVASGRSSSELTFEFTEVSQLYVLRDGRVVVLDRAEGELRLADFAGSTRILGGKGMGPGEYTIPLYLLPLGGDSVGVYDDAGVRVLVIQADGQVGGFVAAMSTSDVLGRVFAQFGDGRGWVYSADALTTRNPAGRMQRSDTLQVVRWRLPSGTAESITRMHYPPPRGMVINEGGIGVPGTSERPGSRNRWVVASDGRIGLVVSDPYHVEIIDASGQRRVGPPVDFARVSLTDAMKEAYLAERVTVSTGVITDANGRSTPVRRQPPGRSSSDAINWARHVPAFRDNAFMAFDTRGVLWVQRTTFHRDGARYDLFGPDGKLLDRVVFPEAHRVVGFGRDVMYVVRRNEDDLEFLQRRPLPR
jgi:hypothetical protein